jgi:hypothetical protein
MRSGPFSLITPASPSKLVGDLLRLQGAKRVSEHRSDGGVSIALPDGTVTHVYRETSPTFRASYCVGKDSGKGFTARVKGCLTERDNWEIPLGDDALAKCLEYHLWTTKNFKQHAGERFERVFVALHPFVQLMDFQTLSESEFDYGDCPVDHPLFFRLHNRRTGPNGEVEDFNSILKLFGKNCSWKSVVENTSFSNFGEIENAINSICNRLAKESIDEVSKIELQKHMTRHRLIMPQEDQMPSMLEASIGKIYEAIGSGSVVIGDEVSGTTAELELSEFLSPNSSIHDKIGTPRVCYSYDTRKEVLTVSDYNNHYTLICLSSRASELIDPSVILEGFWATEATDIHWWAARQTI